MKQLYKWLLISPCIIRIYRIKIKFRECFENVHDRTESDHVWPKNSTELDLKGVHSVIMTLWCNKEGKGERHYIDTIHLKIQSIILSDKYKIRTKIRPWKSNWNFLYILRILICKSFIRFLEKNVHIWETDYSYCLTNYRSSIKISHLLICK